MEILAFGLLALFGLYALFVLVFWIWTPIHCILNKNLTTFPKIIWFGTMCCLGSHPFYWIFSAESRFWKVYSYIHLLLVACFIVVRLFFLPQILDSDATQQLLKQMPSLNSKVEKIVTEERKIQNYQSADLRSKQIKLEISGEQWQKLNENLFTLQTEIDSGFHSKRTAVASEILEFYDFITDDQVLTSREYQDWNQYYQSRHKLRPGFLKKTMESGKKNPN